MKSKGFTLIELLVVISIIGVIASIVLVSFSGSRDKAKIAKSQQFSANINHSLGAYAVGIWDFEDQNNPTADRSGFGNDGTLYGNTHFVANDVLGGHALSFDGSGDYVDCGDAHDVNYITIEAWVKPLATGNRYIISSARDMSPTAGGYHLRISGSKFQGQIWKNSNSSLVGVTGASVTLNEWQHIVFTFNGTDLIMYKNGIAGTPTTIAADTILTPAYPLRIGTHSCCAPLYLFNGTIDDVRIYSEALSTAQIQQHYAQGAAKYGIALK